MAFQKDHEAINAKHPESDIGGDYELVDLVAEPEMSPCVQAGSEISSPVDTSSISVVSGSVPSGHTSSNTRDANLADDLGTPAIPYHELDGSTISGASEAKPRSILRDGSTNSASQPKQVSRRGKRSGRLTRTKLSQRYIKHLPKSERPYISRKASRDEEDNEDDEDEVDIEHEELKGRLDLAAQHKDIQELQCKLERRRQQIRDSKNFLQRKFYEVKVAQMESKLTLLERYAEVSADLLRKLRE